MRITPELVAAFFAGLSLLLGAVVTSIVQLRQVHRAVNSNMSDALKRISDLHDRLEAIAAATPLIPEKPKPRRR